jgi:hypothetical protein
VVIRLSVTQSLETIPSIFEIDRIAALGDPVFRNLQITQAYAELSRALASRTSWQTNWCTFAAWASKQAGQSIRKEDLRRALEHAVRAAFAPPTTQSLANEAANPTQQAAIQRSPDLRLSVERVADAVARGNRKVFAEIGRIFAAFLAEFAGDSQPDDIRLARFCESLRPGDPPDGQEFLRRAFGRYYQAFFEQDAKTRAEFLLFANLEIGYHEQTRLQPEIAEALNAASVNLFALARLLLADEPAFPLGRIARLPGQPYGMALWLARRRLSRRTEANHALGAIAAQLQARMRQVFTEHLMTIQFPPAQIIRLGDDLHVPFPEMLRTLVDPELSAFLAGLDAAPEIPEGVGAHDWANLRQRLRFIVRLFRSYQETPDLFAPPFLPEQTTAIKSNRMPHGRL